MNVMDILSSLCDYLTPFQAALVTTLFFFYLIYIFLKDNDLPPGPLGLPVIGYWPFLKADTCHIQLKDMVEKYGDIFSFRVAGKLFIHLGSVKAIKEAHVTNSESFGGRFSDYSVLSFLFSGGLAILNGEPWKALRKFFLMKFKEYGMNAVKENVTGSIHDALKETVEELDNLKGEPIAITDLATSKCLLILRKILFNDQGITMDEMQEMIDQYKIISSGLNSTTFFLFGKFARYLIFPFMPKAWRIKRSSKRIEDILYDVVNRHKRDYDETQIVDIIDFYIKERDDRRKKGDPTAEYFTDKALVGTLGQIITDGISTVGLLIGTLLMGLVEHPEAQEKIYEELMEVIGPDRIPTVEDKTKLPYTSAFIYEIMRMTDLFPLFPSLECTKEVTIQGHKIPEGSITIVNVYAAHRDPITYEDPDTFNPCRYLVTSDAQRPELPVMFGIGKRACIGEGFSLIQGFLFLTTIVKNFQLSFPEGAQGLTTLFFSEEKLLIRAVPRSQK